MNRTRNLILKTMKCCCSGVRPSAPAAACTNWPRHIFSQESPLHWLICRTLNITILSDQDKYTKLKIEIKENKCSCS